MAVIETAYSMWDRVRDIRTNNPVIIVGLQILKLRPLSSGGEYLETYIVEDHSDGPVQTYYRSANELEKIES